MNLPLTPEQILLGKKLAQEDATLARADKICTVAKILLDLVQKAIDYQNKMNEFEKPEYLTVLDQPIKELTPNSSWLRNPPFSPAPINIAIENIHVFSQAFNDATVNVHEHNLLDIAKGLEILIKRLTEEIDCIRTGVHRVATNVFSDTPEERTNIKC